MKIIITSIIATFISLFIGCTALDLTKRHNGPSPICEIHKTNMHPEKIEVYGEKVYVDEYIEIARKRFPNHGGHLLNFEKNTTPWRRNVIDFVCPKCDKAYREYWKINQKL